jgi:hypothetical protein
MTIDDERDGGYDDNYHIVTFVVASSVNYEASANLTSILQSDAHLTSEFRDDSSSLDFGSPAGFRPDGCGIGFIFASTG